MKKKFIPAVWYFTGGEEIDVPAECYIDVYEVKKILPFKNEGCAVWLYKDEIYWVTMKISELLTLIET